jgi:hypothetical protein
MDSEAAYFDYILPAFESTDSVIMHIKYAFGAGLCAFLALLMYICLTCKMFFGAKAARRVMALARILIFCEIVLQFWLLDWAVRYDMLANRSSVPRITFSTSYSVSFIHHWPRPIIGIVFIGVGLFGDFHASLSLLAVLACLFLILFDAASAVEVRDHLSAVIQYGSPIGDYTKNGLLIYYYRDIVSVGLSSAVMFCLLQYLVLVGFFQPNLIPLEAVQGGESNRAASMRRDRAVRLQHTVERKMAEGAMYVPKEEDMPAMRH